MRTRLSFADWRAGLRPGARACVMSVGQEGDAPFAGLGFRQSYILWKLCFSILLLAPALAVTGCRTARAGIDVVSEELTIRTMLAEQVSDWNVGNLAGFMEGYEKSDATRFASAGNVFHGWQTVHERYRKRYADPAAMGKTTFSDLDVKVLSADAAVAFGRWHQKGVNGEGSGVFTLILRKTQAGWRIIHDHTSMTETK